MGFIGGILSNLIKEFFIWLAQFVYKIISKNKKINDDNKKAEEDAKKFEDSKTKEEKHRSGEDLVNE